MNILEKASNAVDGARQHDYGSPLSNHSTTMGLYELWLTRFMESGGRDSLTPEQALAIRTCAFNICQKLSRLSHSPTHLDSLVDIAGYARNWELIITPPTPLPF